MTLGVLCACQSSFHHLHHFIISSFASFHHLHHFIISSFASFHLSFPWRLAYSFRQCGHRVALCLKKRFCPMGRTAVKHSVASLGEKRFFSRHEALFHVIRGDSPASQELFPLFLRLQFVRFLFLQQPCFCINITKALLSPQPAIVKRQPFTWFHLGIDAPSLGAVLAKV